MTTETLNSQMNDNEGEESEEVLLRKTLNTLNIQRTSMEQEADAIISELTTPPAEGVPPMGLDTPLVDLEGYPRGDIDLYRARTLRGRFQVIKNDHKDITERIETLLVQLAAIKNPNKKQQEEAERQKRAAAKPKPKFDPVTGKWVVMNWDGTVAGVPGGEKRNFHDLTHQVSGLTTDDDVSPQNSSRQASTEAAATETAATTVANSIEGTRPFCRVNAVAAESPAELAGLEEEDLIVQFGPLHSDNHNHLKAIAQLVPEVAANCESIPLHILRRPDGGDMNPQNWEHKELQLAPKPWPGRGLLGCHIVPYIAS